MVMRADAPRERCRLRRTGELVQLRVLVSQNLGDGGGQRRLTVVDVVADRADVPCAA